MSGCSIAVVVASPKAPAASLAETTASVNRQSVLPAERVIVLARSAELGIDLEGWQILHHDQNDLAAAYNAGITATTAPWLIFLNDKHVLPPGYLEAMQQSANGTA